MTIKEITDQYNASDSISFRKKIEDELVERIEKYFADKEIIALKYDFPDKVVNDSDYRHDSGGWSFVEVWNNDIELQYRDMWAYGGSCRINKTVTAQEVDTFDPIEFEKEMKADRIKKLKYDMAYQYSMWKKVEEKTLKELKELEES